MPSQNKARSMNSLAREGHQWVRAGKKTIPTYSSQPKASPSPHKPSSDMPPEDIEALRNAYRMVLASDALSNLRVSRPSSVKMAENSFLGALHQVKPASKPPKREQRFGIGLPPRNRWQEPDQTASAIEAFELEAEQETTAPTPSRKNTWIIGASICLCLVSAIAYAGLGYWLLMSSSPSQAAEPINMMEIQEEPSKSSPVLENLRKLQSQTGGLVVPNEKPPEPAEAFNLIAMAKSAIKNLSGTSKNELIGRHDPFDPLVREGEESSSAFSSMPKDILEDVMFTGYVGDVNAKDKMAIIQVSEGGMPKALIKKVGEAFEIDGEKVVLKSIDKGSIVLSVQGKTRRLTLAPYVDPVSAKASMTPSAAVTPTLSSNSNTANPSEPNLMEPEEGQ